MVYAAAAVVTSPVWGYRLWRTGKWRTDWQGRLGHTPEMKPAAAGAKTILICAVSVGEVNAIRQLVTKLTEGGEGAVCVIIAVTTDTGFTRATELYGAVHQVVRYPFDFTPAVRRFLEATQPDLVALVELEVWPNFLEQCERRRIPVCVINGRLSARSFKNYCKIKPVLRSTFARLTAVGAQTHEYAERFVHMGTPSERVAVLDSMKWDTAQIVPEGVQAAEVIPGAVELATQLGLDRSRPIIVAGSTAPGEDKMLIDTCPAEAQLVIVPRKPEWFDLVLQHAPGIVRRTQHREGARVVDGTKLFLLDTVGELRKAYALADVCIVGRSFLGLYGSDMMEPAALGKPTIVGPYHSDFQDTVDALTAAEGIIITDQPGRVAGELLRDSEKARTLAERGRQVIVQRQGVTQRYVQLLMKTMEHN